MDIPKEEAERIFREMIVPQITGNISPQKTPQAFILGGQPGSGKSAFARELLKTNKETVFINGDDLRAYHPKYYFYLKENDIEAADMTQAVTNFWVESLIQECIHRRLDFIVEGTMRKKEVPIQTARMLHDAKYNASLVVISTPYDLSLLSLEYRYKELKRLGQPARFTKKESHDEAYKNIKDTLTELITGNFGFKKVSIYTRNHEGFSEKSFMPTEKDEIIKHFEQGRNRPLEDKEKDKNFGAHGEIKIVIK